MKWKKEEATDPQQAGKKKNKKKAAWPLREGQSWEGGPAENWGGKGTNCVCGKSIGKKGGGT